MNKAFRAIGIPFALGLWIIFVAAISESLNTMFSVPPIITIIGVVLATVAVYVVLATARRDDV